MTPKTGLTGSGLPTSIGIRPLRIPSGSSICTTGLWCTCRHGRGVESDRRTSPESTSPTPGSWTGAPAALGPALAPSRCAATRQIVVGRPHWQAGGRRQAQRLRISLADVARHLGKTPVTLVPVALTPLRKIALSRLTYSGLMASLSRPISAELRMLSVSPNRCSDGLVERRSRSTSELIGKA
jgi:hypothetical protein